MIIAASERMTAPSPLSHRCHNTTNLANCSITFFSHWQWH